MGFVRQTWTLTYKNLLIVAVRHGFSTFLRAFILPIVFMFFISYAKNFFVPPSTFGIGSPTALRSLSNGIHTAGTGHTRVAFVNNGHTGGQIDAVISNVSGTARAAGMDVRVVESDDDLLTICRSSLRGASACYGAASFISSPTEGEQGRWNYTIRSDGSLETKIFVNRGDNDIEIYVLPFQHAIDAAIASQNGSSLPSRVDEYPFTSESAEERDVDIRRLYMGALINILAVAFYLGIVGVTYQLTGQMASERELGMSQLIEAMTPNLHQWHTQAARLLSNHIAFDIIYLPSWIIMSVIVWRLVFPTSSFGIIVGLHILAGLSLSSFSILGASLFRKAQLSGITVTIVSIVLAIIAQVTHARSVGAVAILSLLFPPMNYTYFIIYMARWERHTLPTDLTRGAPQNPWQLPGIVLWIFFIIQIFTFPVLGALCERSLYGTASKSRRMLYHPSDPSKAIELSGFSKYYPPTWWQRNIAPRFGGEKKDTVQAVRNLSLTALQGQIMVLLGANGSGKSTTLDAIAGLNTITSGTIEVDGTGGLGLCPQKNVLWDELTVYEHVAIFNGLKSTGAKDTKAQHGDLVRACDLGIKLNAKSKTLSGGQKRKLQLAMMFTGGSKVCCVDEVSSGLDPLSRRKIWDILLAERGVRTLLLTTHFLDEGDYLSDHIAMLSKGDLKAEGSAVELKHNFGGGYRVHVAKGVDFQPSKEFEHLSKQQLRDYVVYQLADSSQAARFVDVMKVQNIRDYQVKGPSIEDVFLKLAEEVREDPSEQQATQVVPGSPSKGENRTSQASESEVLSETKKDPELLTGAGTSMPRQTWILFRKRLTILRRNYLPYCAAVIIPIITAGLVTFFILGFAGLSCSPGAQTNAPSTSSIQSLFSSDTLDIPIGPSNRVSPAALATILGTNTSIFHQVESLSEFQSYIRDNYRNVTPGGFFLGDTPTFAYVGNSNVYQGVITQALFDSVLTGIEIGTQFQPFAVPFAPGAGDTLQFILYFGLAMSVYPAFFALYPTVERLRKVRALHYSNGIRAAPLWLAYAAFDFLCVLVISALVTIIFGGVSSLWYHVEYLFPVFFLYGLTSTLYSYVISLFVTSQLAAFAFAAGSQAVLFLIYFISYMTIITYSPASRIDHDVTVAHFTIGLVTPSGNLLRALLLTLNEFSLLCRGRDAIASYPGDILVYGGPVLYLILQAAFLVVFLVWYDSGYKPAFLTRTAHRASDMENDSEVLDSDVQEEAKRVENSEDGLRVLHVSKSFGPTVAVQDVSFGVQSSEVFALLGPNGAGKSTTISLVRGDIRPSQRRGDILIQGSSVIRHRAAARKHLGVCPQFDAMDEMTVSEHLRFYANARGVPDVEHNVSRVIEAVGLQLFRERMASKLSGGNKRKLSLAIALMGNPSVLLLDEPSSGMDAASKRVMWRTLMGVTANRSLVITTHSMEEADALADRAGIMAGRMLALGTSEGLRKKWGDAYHAHLVLTTAPHSTKEEMERVRDWIQSNICGSRTEDRMFHGQIRFSVANASATNKEAEGTVNGVADLFTLLEAEKQNLGVEYYSISQTTLDQVFLAIVGKHNVAEENSGGLHEAGKKGGGIWAKVAKIGRK